MSTDKVIIGLDRRRQNDDKEADVGTYTNEQEKVVRESCLSNWRQSKGFPLGSDKFSIVRVVYTTFEMRLSHHKHKELTIMQSHFRQLVVVDKVKEGSVSCWGY